MFIANRSILAKNLTSAADFSIIVQMFDFRKNGSRLNGSPMIENSLFKFPAVSGEPVIVSPSMSEIISGTPVAHSWRSYADQGATKTSGRWRCSVGSFRVSSEKWEFCHIISGRCIVTRDGGEPMKFAAGDALVLEVGFKGTWEVIEPMEKHFVFVASL
jgi:uncharacterized cupin superfamily protein